MSEQTVHLTFGPVQEFVGQARRTRDLWAGSYLLSYLAGSALARVAGSCRVVLPAVEGNPLMEALRHGGAPLGPGHRVGSVPHIAELSAPADRAGRVAGEAVAGWQEAWTRVGEAVRAEWQRRQLPWTAATEEIWDRQVAEVWTHAWVLGDPAGMARRKTLRAFDLDDEPGEKCTCCGVREVLHAEDASRRGVRAFWAGVAGQIGTLDVQPEGEERLCAVCATKRLFPRVAPVALGWKVPVGFPSTSTMASLSWRRTVLEKGRDDPDLRAAVALYLEELQRAGIEPAISRDRFGETFAGLRAAASSWPAEDREVATQLLDYDGDWFYPEVVGDRERAAVLGASGQQVLLGGLGYLRDQLREAGLSRQPDSFYALLAMDGDRMGNLLRTHAQEKEQVSRALGAFSRRAHEIVEGPEVNGVLIYAGGDDVLALLPRDTALRTAAALRKEYRTTFARYLPSANASISAGLVYAHMNTPLQMVVQQAHRILEDRAKEEAGRDALAVAVWKRPGLVLEFARKWDSGVVADIEVVQKGLEDRTYGRGFLYHLRDLLPAAGPEWTDVTVEAVLAAEYLKSCQRTASRGDAEERVKVLRRLAWQEREETGPVMLAAFLAGEEQ